VKMPRYANKRVLNQVLSTPRFALLVSCVPLGPLREGRIQSLIRCLGRISISFLRYILRYADGGRWPAARQRLWISRSRTCLHST